MNLTIKGVGKPILDTYEDLSEGQFNNLFKYYNLSDQKLDIKNCSEVTLTFSLEKKKFFSNEFYGQKAITLERFINKATLKENFVFQG